MAKKARPYNNGTMTEAMFFQSLRSALRRLTIYWKPKKAALDRVKKSVKGKRHKWEYMCAKCGEYNQQKNVEVDHIIPAGTLRSFDDLGGFAKRLFCEVDGFQVLCKDCHKKKTNE